MKKTLLLGLTALAFSTGARANFVHDWSFGLGTSSGLDRGKCIAQPINNSISSAGLFSGTVDFDPGTGTSNLTSSGTTDMYIMQNAVSGSYMWAIHIGGSGCTVEPSNIITDAGGTIFVCGRINGTADFDPSAATYNVSSTSGGGYDYFLASYSTGGTLNWAFAVGSTGGDEAYGLTMSPSGTSVLVTGFFSGTVDFDPSTSTTTMTSLGGTDGFFARYTASTGAFAPCYQMGGASGDDAVMAIGTDAAGALYATGYFSGTAYMFGTSGTTLTSTGGKDIFLTKLNGTTIAWTERMGGAADDQALDVITHDKYVYVGGGVGAGTIDFPGTLSTMSVGVGEDGLLGCFDITSGITIALEQFYGNGTDGEDLVQNIASDGLGYIYASGLFNSSTMRVYDVLNAVLDNTLTNTTSGTSDFFMSRFNSTLDYKDACNIGGSVADDCPGIVAWKNTLTGAHEVFVTGGFMGTVDFDPNSGVVNHSSGTLLNRNSYLARYSWTTPTRLHAAEEQASTINLFPNPSAGTVTVDHLVAGDVVTLYSLDGKEAASWAAEEDRLSLDLSAFENGVYLLNIRKADGTVVSEKIILQR